jgi:hypothetical protein
MEAVCPGRYVLISPEILVSEMYDHTVADIALKRRTGNRAHGPIVRRVSFVQIPRIYFAIIRSFPVLRVASENERVNNFPFVDSTASQLRSGVHWKEHHPVARDTSFRRLDADGYGRRPLSPERVLDIVPMHPIDIVGTGVPGPVFELDPEDAISHEISSMV